MAEELIELFDGGLQTRAHPSLQEPGTLASMWNIAYPSDARIPMPGPKFVDKGQVNGNVGVEGMAYTEFSNGNRYLFAIDRSNTIRTTTFAGLGAPPGDTQFTWSTATGASITGVDSATTMASAFYDDKYYLFTGKGTQNIVVKNNGTLRPMGMLPVTAAPALLSRTGTWPPGDAPGYYEYWTTEVIRDDSAGFFQESSVDPTTGITTVSVGSNNIKLLVRRGYITKVNSAATHWRVYRSVRKATAEEGAFPNGNVIAELPFLNGSTPVVEMTDGVAASTTATLASAGAVVAGGVGTVVWASPNNITAEDAVYAVGTVTASATPGGMSAIEATFPAGAFSGVANPIRGVELYIKGFYNPVSSGYGASQVMAELIFDGASPSYLGDSYPIWKPIPLETTNTEVVVGSPTQDWRTIVATEPSDPSQGPGIRFPLGTWDASAFTSARCRVRIWVFQAGNTQAATVNIDSVKLKVYHSGTTSLSSENGSQQPYDFIVISSGQDAALASENDPPPVATCGVMFNDMMVTNDVSTRGVIRWSVPGKPESFPAPYFYQFVTPSNDEVTGMWVLGNKLVVATETTMWRVNYLPTEADIQFQRGPMADLIDLRRGAVGPLAGATYINHEGRPELLYLDGVTVRSTDGFTTRDAIAGFDASGFFRRGRIRRRKMFMLNDVDHTTIYACIQPDSASDYIPGITVYGAGYPLIGPSGSMMGINYGPAHNQNGQLTVQGFYHSDTAAGVTDTVKYPSCGISLQDPSLIPAWSRLNANVTLLAYSSRDNSTGGGESGNTLGRVAWLAPRNGLSGLSPNITPNLPAENANAYIITRPFVLGGLGGEFRMKELYYLTRLEFPLTLTAFVNNYDTASTRSQAYPLRQRAVLETNPKQIIDLYGQVIQLLLVFDISMNADFVTVPTNDFSLLSGLHIRWEPLGRENR